MCAVTDEGFYQHRTLLLGIACRMVGTITEAEDILQDVLLDWHLKVKQGFKAESPKAYLAAMVTRKSIDYLRRAYVQREIYPGIWLPESILVSEPNDYSERMILKNNVSMAWMLLLERLSPIECAVFTLRSAFDFDYETISRSVGENAAYCRKIMQRAQQHIDEDKPRYDVTDEQQSFVVQAFLKAANDGDIDALLGTLMPNCNPIFDEGGKIARVIRVVNGRTVSSAWCLAFANEHLCKSSIRSLWSTVIMELLPGTRKLSNT